MSSSTPTNTSKLDRILADNQRDKEMGYRDKALKMYPHVCGRCAREFSGKRLSELTVHHRDHNHDNNPQDGSNWELLCLYCHDNEHSRYTDQQYFGEGSLSTPKIAKATHNPFAALAGLMKKKTETPCRSERARSCSYRVNNPAKSDSSRRQPAANGKNSRAFPSCNVSSPLQSAHHMATTP
jgi:5-methylcytosine-specific restriction endonuclease McrA